MALCSTPFVLNPDTRKAMTLGICQRSWLILEVGVDVIRGLRPPFGAALNSSMGAVAFDCAVLGRAQMQNAWLSS
eukprot:5644703-Alexandrium_andersonii.AAC.1